MNKITLEIYATAKINLKLSKIFLKRLDEIHRLDSQSGDSMLRLITFQEWIDFLLHGNRLMFANLTALEEEAFGKVISCFQSVNGEQQQTLAENRSCARTSAQS
ncbi:GL15146 [Drosophila persimilis]|uniref:GL15146 n=1 Tax=Drosophila persimilis TaxID=7234 RepID=B4H3T1_DROPE|nr:GL15146 [Drosophila persimilis]